MTQSTLEERFEKEFNKDGEYVFQSGTQVLSFVMSERNEVLEEVTKIIDRTLLDPEGPNLYDVIIEFRALKKE